ncbi:MAG: hypothetical protein GX213_06820 [Clostridiaceae bacterium]|nr:hypothetical protein [Clostridiaceae bacterium]
MTADVAYAIDNYVKVSGNNEFLINYGAEILIETARYWVSRFTMTKARIYIT